MWLAGSFLHYENNTYACFSRQLPVTEEKDYLNKMTEIITHKNRFFLSLFAAKAFAPYRLNANEAMRRDVTLEIKSPPAFCGKLRPLHLSNP